MKTPLYDIHVSLAARMVPFAGWDMPIQYRGIIHEHTHTRTEASLFDTCHMGVFELRGVDAEADLERLITPRVKAIAVGACAYGYMLNEQGGVLDDIICFRQASDRFWLVVNAGTQADDAVWVRAHCSPATSFAELTPALAKLDIQGPRSRLLMEQAFGVRLPELAYFHFMDLRLSDTACMLSRTGYTGEWGYELFMPAKEVDRFWKSLTASQEIQPAGLGARDTLRMEMGYPLYGHELKRERTPVGASRGRFISADKPFIGRDIVRREMEQGAARCLVGLQLDGRMAGRASDLVCRDGRTVGEVTSGSFSPSLNVAIALAYVDRDLCGPGQALEIATRNKSLPARVVPLPFYRQGTARAG